MHHGEHSTLSSLFGAGTLADQCWVKLIEVFEVMATSKGCGEAPVRLRVHRDLTSPFTEKQNASAHLPGQSAVHFRQIETGRPVQQQYLCLASEGERRERTYLRTCPRPGSLKLPLRTLAQHRAQAKFNRIAQQEKAEAVTQLSA